MKRNPRVLKKEINTAKQNSKSALFSVILI